MLVGVTEKFAPLALVPIGDPPLVVVYQRMVLFAEVAFKLEDVPLQTIAGVAVTEAGVVGKTFTVKLLELVPVPKGVITLIGPVVAPAGRVAVICVALFTVNIADCPL